MSTPTAAVLVDPRRTTGPIDDRVYGQFIENMGRAVYGGIFEPDSPLADELTLLPHSHVTLVVP